MKKEPFVYTIEALNAHNDPNGECGAREVDELIVAILNLECTSPTIDEDGESYQAINNIRLFNELWWKFISACERNFPSISVFNLVSVETFLLWQRQYKKSVYVTLLTSRITPNSIEAFQQLAHTYETLEEYELGATARDKARRLEIKN